VTIYFQKYLSLSQNDFVNIILWRSQNLFWKTNKAFWVYLTKYFVSNPNPNPDNRIRITRFQQPGNRFLNRVISQLTTIALTVSSELLGFVFIFPYFIVSVPCARLSWPFRELLSARWSSNLPYRIVSYIVTQGLLIYLSRRCLWACLCSKRMRKEILRKLVHFLSKIARKHNSFFSLLYCI